MCSLLLEDTLLSELYVLRTSACAAQGCFEASQGKVDQCFKKHTNTASKASLANQFRFLCRVNGSTLEVQCWQGRLEQMHCTWGCFCRV